MLGKIAQVLNVDVRTLLRPTENVNDQSWGRDKDEDDEQWWRRCIARSAAMMRPSGKKRQKGR